MKGNETKESPKTNWKSVVAGLSLAGLGLAHAIRPGWLLLDWPTVVLLISGAVLCFSAHVVELLPYIKRVRLGEAEVELQDRVKDLSADVERLEDETHTAQAPRNRVNLKQITDTTVESTILDLATKDKRAALLRLAIDIENELAQLCGDTGTDPGRVTWRSLVDALAKKGVLEPRFASALIEFRDVRNRVIHSGLRGPIRDDLLTRSIDNGLQLLRLLKAAREGSAS